MQLDSIHNYDMKVQPLQRGQPEKSRLKSHCINNFSEIFQLNQFWIEYFLVFFICTGCLIYKKKWHLQKYCNWLPTLNVCITIHCFVLFSETKEVDTKELPSETEAPDPREEPTRPQSRHSFVTSRSFLQDKFPQPSKAFTKQVYFVSSSPEPHLRPGSRCTNVTDSLNKPQVTPIVENPYARVDSGFSSRFSNRSYSAGSIRKLCHSPSKMSYRMTEHFSGSNTHIQHACNRTQEKEELQRINDRFTAYIQRVRHLREQSGQQSDTTSFIKSTKILEDEVATLKNLYEKELDNVRYWMIFLKDSLLYRGFIMYTDTIIRLFTDTCTINRLFFVDWSLAKKIREFLVGFKMRKNYLFYQAV